MPYMGDTLRPEAFLLVQRPAMIYELQCARWVLVNSGACKAAVLLCHACLLTLFADFSIVVWSAGFQWNASSRTYHLKHSGGAMHLESILIIPRLLF